MFNSKKFSSLSLSSILLITILTSVTPLGMVDNAFAAGQISPKNTVEINDDTVSGPVLSDTDLFGESVANIGDLDGDGNTDIVVGADQDDAGGADRGAVHIIFLNADGTPKSTVEINDDTANGPTLSDGDQFGVSVANIGDIDSNGTTDIVVGAILDDAGGADRGAVHIIFLIISSDPSSGGGGSDNEHKTRPTFGLDHNRGTQMVENGFTLNGQSYMVTDNYHTPMPMHYINVGETNEFVAKVYAQRGLSVMKFLFGIPDVGQAHNAEAYIMVQISHHGTIKEITVSNSDDLIIDPDSVSITLPQAVRCTESDTVERCMQLSASVKFNESPEAEIFALEAVDFKRRTHTTYFNDGVEIQGESLNPPTVEYITDKYGNTHALIIKEVINGKRMDENGRLWILVDGTWEPYTGRYDQIHPEVREESGTPSVITRNWDYFTTYKKGQALLAEEKLNQILGGKQISTNWEKLTYIESGLYNGTNRADDKELQLDMEYEALKAAQLFEQLYTVGHNHS